MFDYFLKRSADSPDEISIPEGEALAASLPLQAKEIAVQQAKALAGEEPAVEFISHCQFADARLIAAENVHSKAMLERVLASMRNADRRVAKLMQARLDALAAEQESRHRAQQCVDQALSLIDEQVLLLNQVVDLDHAWQLIQSPPASIRAAFENARSILRERLERQAQMQRIIIDKLARMRALSSAADGWAPLDAIAELDKIEEEIALRSASPEAASLPKHLLSEFSAEYQKCKSALIARQEHGRLCEAKQALLQEWEISGGANLSEEALKRAWLALPAVDDDVAANELQLRFNALLQAVIARPARIVPAPPEGVSSPDLAETLAAMEKALQEGSVRAALEIDKLLHSPDLQRVRLSSAQSAQLAKMRSELSHLQGWAKWGGNVSREELLKAAEGLPEQELAAPELARKVGGMRERWKSLDISAGPAGKNLWERFDAACTRAYAPAAAHFKKLADERQENLRKAEAIIAEVRQFASTSDCSNEQRGDADWKAIASFCSHTAQAWQRLGHIDRKDKKRLDAEFGRCMKVLQEPLAEQQKAEVRRREILIAEVMALNPAERSALDKLRALQERWQQYAKALPLERKLEQALWQRFRAGCDALFAKRKVAAAGADAERKQQLAEKESLCAKLESATGESAAAIVNVLRETKESWSKAGPVPRAAEDRIEARFQAAVGALQKQLQIAKRDAADNDIKVMLAKLRMCQLLEQALADAQECAPATTEQWQALPRSAAEFERALRTRFDSAQNAWLVKDKRYLAVLDRNRDLLRQRLLRYEILAGVESPPELSRERLQAQVHILQSTLKAGHSMSKRDALLDLCALAVVPDRQSATRIEQLIFRLSKDN